MTPPASITPPDLTTMIFLIWEWDAALGPRPGRAPPLAERLAPARARFLAKFGRPPALVLLPGPVPTTGIDLPVRVHQGVGRGQVWLGAPAVASPTAPPPASTTGAPSAPSPTAPAKTPPDRPPWAAVARPERDYQLSFWPDERRTDECITEEDVHVQPNDHRATDHTRPDPARHAAGAPAAGAPGA